jgi:hypothetical protein
LPGGVLWSGIYASGPYALGNPAASIGSTSTIVG